MTQQSDLPFEIEAQVQLLRRQLSSEREKFAQCMFRLDDAEKIIERLLQLNFPVLHGQCKAAGMDLIDESTRILRALRTGGEMEQVVELMRRDHTLPPTVAPRSPDGTDTAEVAVSGDLDAESIAALQVLGETADFDVATLRWAQQIELPAVPARASDNLERLADLRERFRSRLEGPLAPYVEQVYVPSDRALKCYQEPTLIYLTEERGVPEYEVRFGKSPVRKPLSDYDSDSASDLPAEVDRERRAFINPATYPSPKCWWLTRVVKTLIELGNRLSDNPFHATVYDPVCDPLPAGEDFLPRYPHGNRNQPGSEPDLIVVLDPRGGEKVYIAVEVDLATRSTVVMKGKMHKNLTHYEGHFDGIFYVAPERDIARRLRTALRAVRSDANPPPDSNRQPVTTAPGLIAIFQASSLVETWLPSPAYVDRWGTTPPEDKPHMAKMFYYYKHKVRH
jgi:hypothetical protein